MRTTITDVRVFDGDGLTEPTTVVVDGPVLAHTEPGDDLVDAEVVDGTGRVLLPGFIDAHVHLHGRETLEQLTAYGVTTALDMATWPPSLLASLRGVPGLTDIRSAGTPAIGPAGPHSHIPGMPDTAVVRDQGQAKEFVAARVAEGVDYIKIVLEAPGAGGPDEDVARALVEAAHAQGLQVVAHAVTPGAYALALDCQVDVITHVPLGQPLDASLVARIGSTVVVPTLSMMEGGALRAGRSELLTGSLRTIAAMHEAGVTVLAGTDANAQPGVPAQIKHGLSLHHELELLVSAGLSTIEALRSATSLPARHFGLPDRGAIAPGLRADLVLIDGDPVADIRATREIVHVWCGGVRHTRA